APAPEAPAEEGPAEDGTKDADDGTKDLGQAEASEAASTLSSTFSSTPSSKRGPESEADFAPLDGDPVHLEHDPALLEGDVPPYLAASVNERAVGSRVARAWRSALSDLRQQPSDSPELDEEVGVRHSFRYRRLVRTRRFLDRQVMSGPLTMSGIWARRFVRNGIAMVLVGVALFFLLQQPPPVEAEASASFDYRYPAAAVLDGRWDAITSEWLLPYGATGWLELRFADAKQLQNLRIKNCSHPPHGTSGSKAIRVEFFVGDDLQTSRTGQFGAPDVNSPWYELNELDVSVDRIRVHIDSFYASGGGLAEIQWDEVP
ncbi:MAG: hypothetical protein AAGF12_38235, partial [Myxococcota bacterium]